jgi:AbrB family looped-hinge helix DNA binding protein
VTTIAIRRVLSRGQVTLPKDIRRRATIKPGDIVHIEAIGKGEVRIVALPNVSPRGLRDLYPIEAEIDEARDRPVWDESAAAAALGATMAKGGAIE